MAYAKNIWTNDSFAPAAAAAANATRLNRIEDGLLAASDTTINVKDYGAVGDGTTDSSTAFTNALTAAQNASISGITFTVLVPQGQFVTGPLTLGNRVTLRGFGVGSSKLILKAGSTAPLIQNAAHAHMCGVHDLALTGAPATNVACHGLVLDNSATYNGSLDESVDGRHFVSNIYINDFPGTGLVQKGSGASVFSNIQVFFVDGHGFDCQTDCNYVNCDAGSLGYDAFIIRGSSNRFASCKGWFAGRITTTGIETDGVGYGFHAANASYGDNLFSACCAQDNARAGFEMNSTGRSMFVNCEADSNNTAGLGHANVEMIGGGGHCWEGISWDRAANSNKALAALRISGGSTYNRVNMTVTGLANMAQGAVTTDSYLPGNDVTLADNTVNRNYISGSLWRRTHTATGTLSIDPLYGVWVFTGTTGTWTLPSLAGNPGLDIWIKNRGSGSLTVSRAGTDQIYSTSAVTSVTVTAGSALRLVSDETYWCVM